jgi:hypothetical protein
MIVEEVYEWLPPDSKGGVATVELAGDVGKVGTERRQSNQALVFSKWGFLHCTATERQICVKVLFPLAASASRATSVSETTASGIAYWTNQQANDPFAPWRRYSSTMIVRSPAESATEGPHESRLALAAAIPSVMTRHNICACEKKSPGANCPNVPSVTPGEGARLAARRVSFARRMIPSIES